MIAACRRCLPISLSSGGRVCRRGPVGRHTEGSTDWKLRAEVLTYSRARGLFAGISFNGAVIKQDEDATGELYGRQIDFKPF